jgi:hypothetical protein
MSEKLNSAIAVIGIDIGKNSFHVVAVRSCCGPGLIGHGPKGANTTCRAPPIGG